MYVCRVFLLSHTLVVSPSTSVRSRFIPSNIQEVPASSGDEKPAEGVSSHNVSTFHGQQIMFSMTPPQQVEEQQEAERQQEWEGRRRIVAKWTTYQSMTTVANEAKLTLVNDAAGATLTGSPPDLRPMPHMSSTIIQHSSKNVRFKDLPPLHLHANHAMQVETLQGAMGYKKTHQ